MLKIKTLKYLCFLLLFACFRCPTEPTYVEVVNTSDKNIILVEKPGSTYSNEYLDSREVIRPSRSRTFDFSPTGIRRFLVGEHYIFYFEADRKLDSIVVPLEDIKMKEHNIVKYR